MLSSGSLAFREHIFNPEYRTKVAGFFIGDLLADPKDSKASMDWSTDVSTPEHIEEFERLLEEGIGHGAADDQFVDPVDHVAQGAKLA